MISSYLNALVLALVVALAAFAIGWLLTTVAVQAIERRDRVEATREAIKNRIRLEQRLVQRREERIKEIQMIEELSADLIKRRQKLDRYERQLKRSGDKVVRLITEELADSQKYQAMVVNKYISPTAEGDGTNSVVDSSWGRPQQVEVYAKSMGEARTIIEKRYQPSFGYVIHNLGVAPKDPVKAALN